MKKLALAAALLLTALNAIAGGIKSRIATDTNQIETASNSGSETKSSWGNIFHVADWAR